MCARCYTASYVATVDPQQYTVRDCCMPERCEYSSIDVSALMCQHGEKHERLYKSQCVKNMFVDE